VPVIGRINGFCLGRGAGTGRLLRRGRLPRGAQLGMPEVHMGIPSVIEAALLPGLIGWGPHARVCC
jgi:enoyl-CoA hydratase/carnithine racemase